MPERQRRECQPESESESGKSANQNQNCKPNSGTSFYTLFFYKVNTFSECKKLHNRKSKEIFTHYCGTSKLSVFYMFDICKYI